MLPLIDGDVICYMACKPRTINGVVYNIYDKEGNRVQNQYTTAEDDIYLQESYKELKVIIENIKETFFADEYLMAVKSPTNYRSDLYSEYKMNRHCDPSLQNKFVPTLRKLLVDEELAIEATDREADDYIRIWANECERHDIEYVVCTIDKDLKCIPGNFYNLRDRALIKITPLEASRHFYEQLLKGDATDNIPGIPGIGPKKAEKALVGCTTDEEFQEQVVAMYFDFYGEAEWFEYLLSNGKLLYIQEGLNTYFTPRDWKIVKELL